MLKTEKKKLVLGTLEITWNEVTETLFNDVLSRIAGKVWTGLLHEKVGISRKIAYGKNGQKGK